MNKINTNTDTNNTETFDYTPNYKLAEQAYKKQKNDYSTLLFLAVAGFIVFSILLITTIEFRHIIYNYYSNIFLICFCVIVLYGIVYGFFKTIKSLSKLKKCHELQNYTYHHVKIKNIEPRGQSRLHANFSLNGKSYSEPINNNGYKTKYLHVFDYDGIIVFLEDTEDLLK